MEELHYIEDQIDTINDLRKVILLAHTGKLTKTYSRKLWQKYFDSELSFDVSLKCAKLDGEKFYG